MISLPQCVQQLLQKNREKTILTNINGHAALSEPSELSDSGDLIEHFERGTVIINFTG